MHYAVTLKVNGDQVTAMARAKTTLLELLRYKLQLTGTKRGCEVGDCGACTVLLNGEPVCSCLVLAVSADGADVQTVEGLAAPDGLHPLQAAFVQHHGLQCGACTPGMLMSAAYLLSENPQPTADEVRAGMHGNLCRCTGYHKIVEAVQAAAKAMGGGTT